MNTLKACLGAAAGLVVLTLTFTLTESGRAAAQGMKPLLVQVTNTAAEPVPVTTVVPAADRVLLEFRGCTNNACPESTVPLSRILPDGTVEDAFSVPAGRMLVLTDLEGIIRPGYPMDGGSGRWTQRPDQHPVPANVSSCVWTFDERGRVRGNGLHEHARGVGRRRWPTLQHLCLSQREPCERRRYSGGRRGQAARLPDLRVTIREPHFASGSGRSWKRTTLLVVPLPVSMWNGVRVLTVDQSPLPFQPVRGSSMRPSIHFV